MPGGEAERPPDRPIEGVGYDVSPLPSGGDAPWSRAWSRSGASPTHRGAGDSVRTSWIPAIRPPYAPSSPAISSAICSPIGSASSGWCRRERTRRSTTPPTTRPAASSPSSWCALASLRRPRSAIVSTRRCGRSQRSATRTSPPSTTGAWRASPTPRRRTSSTSTSPAAASATCSIAGAGSAPSQALAVGLDACRALDHAHRRRFVHGELNPSKIVFGDDRRLRIIDFGLARAAERPHLGATRRRAHPRGLVRRSRAGPRRRARRAHRRVRAVPHPARGGHRQPPVPLGLHRRVALGAGGQADAGVGRPRPARRRARTRRPTRARRAFHGRRAGQGPAAGRVEAAPPRAAAAALHRPVRDPRRSAPQPR
jgi:hypothetical protein